MNGAADPLTRQRPPGQGPGWPAVAVLVTLAAIAAAIVGFVYDRTRERIAGNVARHTLAELATILPPALYDNEPHRDLIYRDVSAGPRSLPPQPVYRARRGGQPVAAVLTVTATDGYVGPIRLLVAIRIDGTVLGVRVAEHTETPGIGDAIEPGKSAWLETFRGRSLASTPATRWKLRRDDGDIDQVTGATITSRAVVSATRVAVQYFTGHQQDILTAATAGTEP
jgi:electron transport complex protein RnfG